METERIFEVGKAKRYLTGDGSRWLVRGRTYEDIRVGDVLYPEDPDRTVRTDQPLVIVSLAAFRRSTPVLSQTMTGDVTVEGHAGDNLTGVAYLLRGEKGRR